MSDSIRRCSFTDVSIWWATMMTAFDTMQLQLTHQAYAWPLHTCMCCTCILLNALSPIDLLYDTTLVAVKPAKVWDSDAVELAMMSTFKLLW